jgi:hypothetical protein
MPWRCWFASGLLFNIARADARPIVAGAARHRAVVDHALIES